MLVTLPVSEDYSLTSNTAVMALSATTDGIACISIAIADDDVLEGDESIVIRLEADVTQLSNDVANGLSIGAPTLIFIEDNDGMCIHVGISHVKYTIVILFLGFVTIQLSSLEILPIEEEVQSGTICIESIVVGRPQLPSEVDSLDFVLSFDGSATGIAIYIYIYIRVVALY